MNAAALNKAMTHDLFTSIDVVYSKCLCFYVCHACFLSGLEHDYSEVCQDMSSSYTHFKLLPYLPFPLCFVIF